MTQRLRKLAAVLLAPLLLWPALLNHYPLLFPDTLDYLASGRPILHALFHAHPSFDAMRSALYALLILPFHFNLTPWPVLVLHAAMVVYPVYLTVRSMFPLQAFRRTIITLVVLSVLSTMSWYISLLMPDILGAALYLALYLLVFARRTLSRVEHGVVMAIAVLGATAHASHLVLGFFLCALLGVLALFRWKPMRTHRRDLALATGVLLCAGLLQCLVNARLDGHFALNPNRAPYLEARVLADGPGSTYLREHCLDHADWFLCQHLDKLPNNDDEFLWSTTGLWSTATPAQQAELRREEMPLVFGTLAAYPADQITASFTNFTRQLVLFGMDDFDNNDYMQANLGSVLRNARPQYDRSLQSQNAVPSQPFTLLQDVLVPLSAVTVLLLSPVIYRRRNVRLMGLATIVVAVLLANALLTGAFSEVDARYQARVVWLLPMLAILFLFDYRDGMNTRDTY